MWLNYNAKIISKSDEKYMFSERGPFLVTDKKKQNKIKKEVNSWNKSRFKEVGRTSIILRILNGNKMGH